MAKPEKIFMKFQSRALVPVDDYAIHQLRERKFRIGDVVAVEITKSRNPGFNRLAHSLGKLCAANIDEFKGRDAHTVIKQIQLRAGIECEESIITVPGGGEMLCKQPKSIGFASMGQETFRDMMLNFCRYVAENYFEGLTAEQVQVMAEKFIEE